MNQFVNLFRGSTQLRICRTHTMVTLHKTEFNGHLSESLNFGILVKLSYESVKNGGETNRKSTILRLFWVWLRLYFLLNHFYTDHTSPHRSSLGPKLWHNKPSYNHSPIPKKRLWSMTSVSRKRWKIYWTSVLTEIPGDPGTVATTFINLRTHPYYLTTMVWNHSDTWLIIACIIIAVYISLGKIDGSISMLIQLNCSYADDLIS